MITEFRSIRDEYALCGWIDEHYGKVEIITIIQSANHSSYKVFYHRITQPITNAITNEEQ